MVSTCFPKGVSEFLGVPFSAYDLAECFIPWVGFCLERSRTLNKSVQELAKIGNFAFSFFFFVDPDFVFCFVHLCLPSNASDLGSLLSGTGLAPASARVLFVEWFRVFASCADAAGKSNLLNE